MLWKLSPLFPGPYFKYLPHTLQDMLSKLIGDGRAAQTKFIEYPNKYNFLQFTSWLIPSGVGPKKWKSVDVFKMENFCYVIL